MGILDRFATIVKANINELLDHAEDPAKMIDQYLVDLTDSLAEVKKETACVMAEEKRTKRLVDENASEVARMEELAKKAPRATPAPSSARSSSSRPPAPSSSRPTRPRMPTPRRCARCTTSL